MYNTAMPGDIKFEFDENLNVLYTEDNFELKTEQDVEEFFRLNEAECLKHGGKFYLISNVDKLKIHAPVIGLYGVRGKALVDRYLLGHARYAVDPFARMAIRTAYSKAGVKCSIFEKKDEALESLGLGASS
jgi:hypothetical protein